MVLVGLLHGCALQAPITCNLFDGLLPAYLLPAYCYYFKMSLIRISVRVENGSDLGWINVLNISYPNIQGLHNKMHVMCVRNTLNSHESVKFGTLEAQSLSDRSELFCAAI